MQVPYDFYYAMCDDCAWVEDPDSEKDRYDWVKLARAHAADHDHTVQMRQIFSQTTVPPYTKKELGK